jgi:DNA-binding response OmpR family regulator
LGVLRMLNGNQAPTPAMDRPAPGPERYVDRYMTKTVLVVHRDEVALHALMAPLRAKGFSVQRVAHAEQAIDALDTVAPEIIAVDVTLGEESGLGICVKLRRRTDLPIVLVGNRDPEAEVVRGLELGADGYITLPCGVHELAARLGALIRRCQHHRSRTAKLEANTRLGSGDVVLDVDLHQVTIRGDQVHVTPKQFALLELFLRHPGHTLTRDRLMTEIWGYDRLGDTKPLATHIQRLRLLLERDPTRPERIVTVWGVGYRYCAHEHGAPRLVLAE